MPLKNISWMMSLLEVIKAREQITSSYFGNCIAVPHPLTPFSDETFVSLGVLKKPIAWDKNHNVRVVMLVSIERIIRRHFSSGII